jgi:hypothetical protein
MRNFFNLPQAGFGAKGKRWSPFRRAVCGFRTEQTFAALEQALGDLIHLELHIDVSFDLLCDQRINGLMPRQQLDQPDHLNEADLHNFTDLVPCRLRMAVSCAIATNRERNATSKAIEPDSTQPVVSSAKADGEPF